MYKKVRAKGDFLTPEEGGRSYGVDLRDPQDLYRLSADFGFGYTEEGYPIRCPAQVSRETPGFIELGREQSLLVEFACPDRAVKAGAYFELFSKPKELVARGTVLSVLEIEYE